MNFELIVWLAERATGLTWIEAQQTHTAPHTDPARSWAVFTAQGLDSRGLHSATLWREI